MQRRFECHLTGADDVTQQGWLSATLPRCPLHPQGGCGFARHGTYARASPPGTRVARWYCPEGHRTFSLLPDCLAARLSGTLSEVEAVVRAAEQAPSLEALPAPLGFTPRRCGRGTVGEGEGTRSEANRAASAF